MRLIAQGITHSFGPRRVLDGVDLDARVGEAVAILGASGSGKTTLLAILGGLIEADSGQVITEPAVGRIADHVAWVPQSPSLLPNRSAYDNAALPLALAGRRNPSDSTRVRDTLAAMGLSEVSHKRARYLSGGEQQRVAIARCSLSGRPIILADEPTGQLDRATSAIVTAVLLDLRAGAIVLIATHDLDVARSCDRVLDLQHRGLP